MQFQERDGQLLQALHTYGGVLSRRHIQALFWPEARSMRAMNERLAKLYRSRFIDWPSATQRRAQPGPKSICWLGWRGAVWIAAQAGVKLKAPARENENQLRGLEKRLREQGICWVREPAWSQLEHDLAVVDFRLAVEREVQVCPTLTLETWVDERTFRAAPDVVEVTYVGWDGRPRQAKRGVIPDGYLMIVDEARRRRGDPRHRARLLLELDMATHSRGRFAREKLLAGAAYIRSPAYRARLGANAGHWLVVTTGPVRMRHLMEQAAEALGASAKLFLFTTLDHVQDGHVLTAPIWWWVSSVQPQPLIRVNDRG